MKKIIIFCVAIVCLNLNFEQLIIHATVEEQIDEKNEEIEQLNEDISKLDEQLTEYDNEIAQLESQIADIEHESREYQNQIDTLNENIEQNEQLVNFSLITLQQSSNSNMIIDYVFGNSSEGLDNLTTATKTIYGSLDIINKYINDVNIVEYNYNQIDNNVEEIEAKIAEIDTKKNEINDEIASYQSQIDEVNSSLADLHSELISESVGVTSTDGRIAESDREAVMSAGGVSASEYEYAEYILFRESGWNYLAVNSSSGAYGLCQSLPGTKMATAGSDWKTNPVTQMKWCNNYAMERYGSWQGAYSFWNNNHWW